MRIHSELFSYHRLRRLSSLEARLSGRFRRCFLLLLAVVILSPSLAGIASAGVDTWTTNGPEVSFIAALAIDPSAPATLYAGTSGDGLFKSRDGGASWGPINTGLTSTFINALAIDPSAPATLYAGTDGDGVFKSTNRGGSWTPINTGLTNTRVFALAIDPSAPATLYAGTFGGGVVFKSTNGGDNWAAIKAGLVETVVWALAVDPSTPSTLYAGTYVGLFRSTDGGGHWSAINRAHRDSVFALAIDPSAPATLYSGWYDHGVFKSTDAGVSWTEMNTGLASPNVTALAIDPTLPTKLYAGTDSGVYDIGAGTDGEVDDLCVPGPKTLCLSDGRFKVTTRWETSDGRSGSGRAVATTANAGYFTFFNRRNIELTVKVLDRCSSSGSFWVQARGQTTVYVVMTVTDSWTGAVKIYTNPQGSPFRPVRDTGAFETC